MPKRFVARSIDRSTIAEQVYQILRDQILSNFLPPGEPLLEAAIAAELKVSRAPVRDAIRRLAAEGLATVIPRKGALVAALTPQDFLDAYQVREALEMLAVRLAIPRLTDEDLARLNRIHRDMAAHAERGDVEAFFEANHQFHVTLVELSGNRKLQEVYRALMHQMRRYRIPSMLLRGGMARSVEEHQAILDALGRRDIPQGVRLISEHIQVPQRALGEGQQPELVIRPLPALERAAGGS
jgi:DNA-binding GntR family transcriptional regulator